MRFGRVMFDAYVAILDPKKFELASCDDTPLLRNDAFASIIAPEDGDYRIVVHEAAYEGNENCQYRLHIGTFPRPTAVFPTGGKPGETIEFTFIGDPSGPIKQSITLPPAASGRFPVFPQHDGLAAPSPHWITVSPLDSVSETGANHDAASATARPARSLRRPRHRRRRRQVRLVQVHREKGPESRLPSARPQPPLAARLRSIHPSGGRQTTRRQRRPGRARQHSSTGPAPPMATTRLQIRDQLNRTGPDFTYRIEITEKSPAIAATLPTVERVHSPEMENLPRPARQPLRRRHQPHPGKHRLRCRLRSRLPARRRHPAQPARPQVHHHLSRRLRGRGGRARRRRPPPVFPPLHRRGPRAHRETHRHHPPRGHQQRGPLSLRHLRPHRHRRHRRGAVQDRPRNARRPHREKRHARPQGPRHPQRRLCRKNHRPLPVESPRHQRPRHHRPPRRPIRDHLRAQRQRRRRPRRLAGLRAGRSRTPRKARCSSPPRSPRSRSPIPISP